MLFKARAKIKALARIAPFLNKRKRKLMNAFIKCQFSYCPLSWMFHSLTFSYCPLSWMFYSLTFSYCLLSWMFYSRTLNNKINRLHERCLRITYNDNTSPFVDFLEIDNSVSVHHRNIQVLATEQYKFVNSLSPKLVSECFKLNNMTVYKTRNRSTFYSL